MTKVSELMTRGVRAMSPRDSVAAAARMMDEFKLAVVPVCDDGTLVGLVTDRDITVRAVARGLPPLTTPLGFLMSTAPLWCYEDQSIDEVQRTMKHCPLHRLPVIDRERRLVGMLSLGAAPVDES
ncbi:CBS domain-containing protein [Variovorax paradoxus]|nr:CBS domain-containing protein [Variovorax paradoxus]